MSSHSCCGDCPRCGTKDSLEITESTRPIHYSGECLECGYSYWTKDIVMSLEEVNEIRVESDRQPLEKLKEALA